MPTVKILVADDEPGLVRLAQIHLTRAGYEVITAADGKEALEIIERDRPNLVVLDVMMPHMDGFEVLHRVQAHDELKQIPVVMLTAQAQDHAVLHGMQSGAAKYLTKPFNPMELTKTVAEVLEHWSRGEQ
jgi:DNA-binding response OmpR family regulator